MLAFSSSFFPFHPRGNPFWAKQGLLSSFTLASFSSFFPFHPRNSPFWTKRGSLFYKKGVSGFTLASFSSFFPFHPRNSPFWTKRGSLSYKKGVSGFTPGTALFEQNEARFLTKRAFLASPPEQPFLNKTRLAFLQKGRFWLHASFFLFFGGEGPPCRG